MHEPRPWSYETCDTCRFFRKWDERVPGGDCRRFPPAYIGPIPKDGWSCDDTWKYPPMEDDDWCGEYRAKGVTNG